MANRKKVCFIIPDLGGGGAEHVCVHLLRHLPRDSFDLELLLFKKEGVYLDEIPGDVTVQSLNLSRIRFFLFRVFGFLSSCSPKTLVIFNVNNLNIVTIVAKLFFRSKFRVIVREPTILSLFLERYPFVLRKTLHFLHKWAYYLSNHVIALSDDMRTDLLENFRVKDEKISIINNPIDAELMDRSSPLQLKFPLNVIFIGRVIAKKGVHKIIEAFTQLDDDQVGLYILGDSDDEGYKKQLSIQIQTSKLKDNITLTGFVPNPTDFLASADVLAMGSEFEGFPNVAIEANYLGKPIVAFESIGGLNDIIRDGENGWIILESEIAQFAAKLRMGLEGELDGENIKQKAMSNYRMDTIVRQYQTVLSE